MRDSFRERHPDAAAYMYFSASGGASRLDAILWRPPPESNLKLLNASIVWRWPRRVDHDPVVADFSWPVIPEEDQDCQLRWRDILKQAADQRDSIQQEVEVCVDASREELLRIQTRLQQISVMYGRSPTGESLPDRPRTKMPWRGSCRGPCTRTIEGRPCTASCPHAMSAFAQFC